MAYFIKSWICVAVFLFKFAHSSSLLWVEVPTTLSAILTLHQKLNLTLPKNLSTQPHAGSFFKSFFKSSHRENGFQQL